ncbi:MAG: NAD-dependent epimerase/dehydratase family protein [Ardenticatenaceae bacterium]|nr:NAD-dependent epimerase/dehydratase family protein [Ardenticatenaceae bacterium]
MKAFVTGGSGFIGQHVIRKLIARGYMVAALARSAESQAIVEDLGATAVPGDVTDMASMRDGMAGSDIVFHIAAWYKLGTPDWMQAEAINVSGTRKVLRLAQELGVPRIIYTSTIAVLGDTHGELVDETYFQSGPFITEYARTKWLAHYKVAVPFIEKGAPIIIVMPGAVYGPGDTSIVADLMRFFYRGAPAVPGLDTTFAYTHVEDIAEGHILAAEKGKIGESYILAGPAIPLGEMIDFWAHLTGKRAPSLKIPASLLRPFTPVMGALESIIPLPAMFSREAVASLGATYMARSDKARAELGWQTRPLQTGMLETFAWIADEEAERAVTAVPRTREQQIAKLALSAAFTLFLAWLLYGRRRK